MTMMNDNGEPLAPIAGEAMYAAALAETLCNVLVLQNPSCRQSVQESLEAMRLCWARIAANPDYATPEALAHARRRLEEFIGRSRAMIENVLT
jgi:hypothetical protein